LPICRPQPGTVEGAHGAQAGLIASAPFLAGTLPAANASSDDRILIAAPCRALAKGINLGFAMR